MLKNSKSKFSILVILVLTICVVFSSEIFAQKNKEIFGEDEKSNVVSWKEKISQELWSLMEDKNNDDIIPVWLWLTAIDDAKISNIMMKEKELDSAIYENEERFNEEVAPEITQRIEERVGNREAHKRIQVEQMNNKEKRLFKETYDKAKISENFNENDNAFYDNNSSLVDRAVSAEVDKYIIAKREIISREYSAMNNDFIKNIINNNKRKILYNSRFTSTLVIEATKAEIEAYAKNKQVEEISLFVNMPLEQKLDVVAPQVRADDTTSTKSINFNHGDGYRGLGVRIGIIEANTESFLGRASGFFDHFSPHLENISEVRLFKSNLPGSSSLYSTKSDHATLVTSIIVGQSATTLDDRVKEGIAPSATAYQVSTPDTATLLRDVQTLIAAPYSVNVINASLGANTGAIYHDVDKELDRILVYSGVTFVNAAGNLEDGNYSISSPGKAFNVITVGNTSTSDGKKPLSTPYSMNEASCYVTENYLPNKPDITAPGTNISCIGAYNNQPVSGTSFSAPVVTGIVAQMMQANPWLKTNPTAVKAKLLLGADSSKISTSSNPTANNPHLRNKSGAGLVDAVNATRAVKSTNGLDFYISSPLDSLSQSYYFHTGQKIRVVMVHDKINTNIPSSNSLSNVHDLDAIGLHILNSSGTSIANSYSEINNVEIIEYTFTSSGYYNFLIKPYRMAINIGSRQFSGVNAHIAWTITNPGTIKISNVTELSALRNNLNGNYELINDINLNNSIWKPIGTEQAPFKGRINGNGHTIKNLKINYPNTSHVGLFAYADGAIFENMNIKNANVVGNWGTGGLVGFLNNGRIENCSVSAGLIKGRDSVGGVAGFMSNGEMTGNYSQIDVMGTGTAWCIGGLLGEMQTGNIAKSYATGKVFGSNYIGGLLGRGDGNIIISNCFADSDIDSNGYSGGIAGILCSNGSQIQNSYYTGNIKGSNIGALVGFNGGMTPTNSYFNSNSTGLGSPTTQARSDTQLRQQSTFNGWDFKNVWSMSTYPILRNVDIPVIMISNATQLSAIRNNLYANYKLVNDINLNNALWTPIGASNEPFMGTFDGNGYVISNLKINSNSSYAGLFSYADVATFKNIKIKNVEVLVPDSNYVGGIVGRLNHGKIENCSVETGLIKGRAFVGGIVGLMLKSDMLACNAQINVEGTEFPRYIGGVIGEVSNGNIIRSYAKGNVKGERNIGGLLGFAKDDVTILNCFADSSIVSDEESGGLVGGMETSDLKIRFSYFIGYVFGRKRGGLVSGDKGTITSSYFNSTTTGITTPTELARTDSQLRQKATFVGWDFTHVWRTSSTYPIYK